MTQAKSPFFWSGLLIGLLLLLFGALLFWNYSELLTLTNLKAQRVELLTLFERRPMATVLVFCAVYILFSSVALPGATILTITGGALFGLFWGTVMVLVSSSLGATIACFFSRCLFRDAVQRRYGDKLEVWTESFERNGPLFLFSLRLVPLVPFALINILMGLVPISFFTFFWVTLVGVAPATLIYVNAGTNLSELNSLKDVISLPVLLSLVLIGLLPWTAKRLMTFLNTRRN